jgi:hypothetical protein
VIDAGEIQHEYQPPVEGYDPSEAGKMRDEAKEMYDDARVRAWARFPKWARNAALYHGEHYGRATPYGDLPESVFDESIEPVAREKHNYIRPFVDAAIADTLRNFPQPEAVAKVGDPKAVSRADYAHRLIRSFVYSGVISFEQLYRAELAARLMGGAFYKLTWDPFRGRAHRIPTGGIGRFGRPAVQLQHEGELAMRAVDLFDALPNPDAACSEDVDYVFHRQLMARRKLDDLFPVDMYGRPTRGRWEVWNLSVEQGERDLVQRSNDLGNFWPSNKSQRNEMCEVIEFWERPCFAYPEGRFLKFCGDAIIYAGPLPFTFPWVYRHGGILHSELIGDGMVDDLEGPQLALNDMMSQIREWIRDILRPGAAVAPAEWPADE